VQKKEIETRRDRLLQNSCDWLLKIYAEFFIPGPETIFWLRGSPGKGKTMMAMALVDHVARNSQLDEDSIFCYFFCDNMFANRNTLIAALKSILRQAIEAVVSTVITNDSSKNSSNNEVLLFLEKLKPLIDRNDKIEFSSAEAVWIQLDRVVRISYLRKPHLLSMLLTNVTAKV
jgi:Cdc6-like AAA superfamily ATPase